MAISFDTLNSTKTYTFMGPSSGGGSNIFTYTVEVTLNSSNSTQDYFSFDVTLKIRCNQPTFSWVNWSSQRVKLYMNAGSGASTNSEYLIHDAGLPDYSTGQPTVTIFTKENILISKPSGTTLYITIKVENTTGTSITYLPGSVTNSNTISVAITSGLDTMKLYPESAIQNIASAIRSVNGLSSTYKVPEMAQAINNLPIADNENFRRLIERTIAEIPDTPSIYQISSNTFTSCNLLTSVSLSQCTLIGYGAFQYCSGLSKAWFSNCSSICSYAFRRCNLLSDLSFPKCESIDIFAFSNCSALTLASFPSCTSIGTYAFHQCTNLTTLSFPECITIGSSAFYSCISISNMYFPKCTTVSNYAFHYCYSMTSTHFPSCMTVGSYAFSGCSKIESINLPKCTTIRTGAFLGCWSLNTVSLSDCGTIYAYAFSKCYHLLSLYLNGSVVASLSNINAFNSTPISNYTTSTGGTRGKIYVPASLLNTYKAATNWINYSSIMVAM